MFMSAQEVTAGKGHIAAGGCLVERDAQRELKALEVAAENGQHAAIQVLDGTGGNFRSVHHQIVTKEA